MQRSWSIWTLLLIIFLVLGAWPTHANAALLLSEVQIGGDKAADEFVELYNSGSDSISLSGYSLRRKSVSDVTAKGSSLKTFGASDTIGSQKYFLWTSSTGIFKDIADTTTTGGLSENNSLGLFDKNGILIESLTWGTGHVLPFTPTVSSNPAPKESLIRDLHNLQWAITKATSPTNSLGVTWVEPVILPPVPSAFKAIVINEVFPNPKTKGDTGEFIELYNPLAEAVDLSDWEIHDASAIGKYTFPNGSQIGSLDYRVVTDTDFKLSLNNSNETLSLYDKEKRLVHSVHYDKTKEDVTLNLVGDKLRGGKLPTPGKANVLNTDPITREKVPKTGYKDIPVEFRARGSDSDGDSLKYIWNFGDDHRSYKDKTTHTYRETGQYTVTLTTDDGSDTSIETFEIKIEKYRAPKLRIVALAPNPTGDDAEFEWIEIENREKKTVNLKGFSIATGSKRKSITNHPIRDDFEIKGKAVKRLTRDESKFVLNNKKGFVELRDPTGKVVHSLKYTFDKSLAEGVVLHKVKGQALSVETLPDETLAEESTETIPPLVPEANTPTEAVLPEIPPKVAPVPPTEPTILGVSTEATPEMSAINETPQPIGVLPKEKTFFTFLWDWWQRFERWW